MMKTLQATPTTPKYAVGTILYVPIGGVWYSYTVTKVDNTSYPPAVYYWGVMTVLSTGLSYANVEFTEDGLVTDGASTTAPTLVPVATTGTSTITDAINFMMPWIMMVMMFGMIMPMMQGLTKSMTS